MEISISCEYLRISFFYGDRSFWLARVLDICQRITASENVGSYCLGSINKQKFDQTKLDANNADFEFWSFCPSFSSSDLGSSHDTKSIKVLPSPGFLPAIKSLSSQIICWLWKRWWGRWAPCWFFLRTLKETILPARFQIIHKKNTGKTHKLVDDFYLEKRQLLNIRFSWSHRRAILQEVLEPTNRLPKTGGGDGKTKTAMISSFQCITTHSFIHSVDFFQTSERLD